LLVDFVQFSSNFCWILKSLFVGTKTHFLAVSNNGHMNSMISFNDYISGISNLTEIRIQTRTKVIEI